MRAQSGFTLIEVAVVLLLITIVLGMVGLRLDNDVPLVREESARLRLLVQAVQEEAALRGEVLGVAVDESGYRLMRRNAKGDFEPMESAGLLAAHALPEGMQLRDVTVDGEDVIAVSPTGELSAFSATLAKGEIAWRIEGTANGRIAAQPL